MEPPDMHQNATATREDINRLSDKVDGLHNVFVTRGEYAQMHTALTAMISSVASQVTALANQVDKNRETVDNNKAADSRWFLERIEAAERRLSDKLDMQDVKIDEKFETQSTKLTARSQWRTGIVWAVVATVISGSLAYLLPHIIH